MSIGLPVSCRSPETSLLKRDGFLPAGFRCGIEILNDNATPMEFVVSVLQSYIGLDRNAAIKTMLTIHKKGGIMLPIDSFDESRRIAELISAEARGACEQSSLNLSGGESIARPIPRASGVSRKDEVTEQGFSAQLSILRSS